MSLRCVRTTGNPSRLGAATNSTTAILSGETCSQSAVPLLGRNRSKDWTDAEVQDSRARPDPSWAS